MKEQQKRKFKQIHPEIEDGIDLRRCPHQLHGRVKKNGESKWQKCKKRQIGKNTKIRRAQMTRIDETTNKTC